MSEPQRIGELLPDLLADIDQRRQARAERQRKRVVAAVRDYHCGGKARPKTKKCKPSQPCLSFGGWESGQTET